MRLPLHVLHAITAVRKPASATTIRRRMDRNMSSIGLVKKLAARANLDAR